jgi:hypothetical protein
MDVYPRSLVLANIGECRVITMVSQSKTDETFFRVHCNDDVTISLSRREGFVPPLHSEEITITRLQSGLSGIISIEIELSTQKHETGRNTEILHVTAVKLGNECPDQSGKEAEVLLMNELCQVLEGEQSREEDFRFRMGVLSENVARMQEEEAKTVDDLRLLIAERESAREAHNLSCNLLSKRISDFESQLNEIDYKLRQSLNRLHCSLQ